MARFTLTGSNELIARLQQLGDGVETAGKAILEAGAAVVVKACRASIGRNELVKTGAMLDSVASSRVKEDRDGAYVEITLRGKDKRGVRNAEKGFILNYGSSRIKPTYWVDEARRASEGPARAAMEAAWAAFIAGRDAGGGTGAVSPENTTD